MNKSNEKVYGTLSGVWLVFCLSQIESLKYKTDHMKNEKYNHGKQENTDTLLHNE
jgi:hypothetical protein